VPKETKVTGPSQQLKSTSGPGKLRQLTLFLRKIVAAVTSKDLLRQHLRSSLYRNSYYLMMANAANAALGLVFWMLGARLYSADDVGVA